MPTLYQHIAGGLRASSIYQLVWLVVVCAGLLLTGCPASGRQVTPQLASPPRLTSAQIEQQGKTVNRPLAPDLVHYDLPPATLAVLTNEVAEDMGWKEHSIMSEEPNTHYTVVMSEGSALGIQRQVRITPAAKGSDLLILPPDENLAARIQDRVFAYLTGLSKGDADVSPRVRRFPRPFSVVWQKVKETLIDGGFSFKTVDNDVGFIETEPVPLGKASMSWFQGVGQLSRIARSPSMRYSYTSVQWRYRIRVKSIKARTSEVSVEAVIEATPDTSTVQRLASGTLNVLSVPFGSWISSAATGEKSGPRIILPSRGKLEKDFLAGLAKQ